MEKNWDNNVREKWEKQVDIYLVQSEKANTLSIPEKTLTYRKSVLLVNDPVCPSHSNINYCVPDIGTNNPEILEAFGSTILRTNVQMFLKKLTSYFHLIPLVYVFFFDSLKPHSDSEVYFRKY